MGVFVIVWSTFEDLESDKCMRRNWEMLVVTTNGISGRKLQELGVAKGTTVQSVHFGKDLMSGFKTLVGGELTSYNEMMDNARGIATQRMEADAAGMGADAVVGVRYASSSVTQGAAEVMCYGTAVKFVE